MSGIVFIQPYDFPTIYAGRFRKSAYLSRVGFEVGYQIPAQYDFSILDLNLAIHNGKTITKSIIEEVSQRNPEIIFITFPSFAQGRQIRNIIKAIRIVSNDCKIILGGGVVSLIKDAPLRWWGEYNIFGCYDGFGESIPSVIDYVLGKTHIIPSGLYVGSGVCIKGRNIILDGYSAGDLFSSFGRIDFLSHLELFKSARLQPVGLIEMMRGCRYHCGFCAINNERLGCYFRSAKTVASEAEFLAGHGIKHFHIIDPTFGLDNEPTYALLDYLAIIHRKQKVTFEVVTRADMVSRDFASALKSAGVIRCGIGMETMSVDRLMGVNKMVDSQTIRWSIDCLAGESIQVKLFHITFPNKVSTETILFLMNLAARGTNFLVQSSYFRELPNANSAPSFSNHDHNVFIPGYDTNQELMERIIISLCFQSMDTNYHEDELQRVVANIIGNNLAIESLFKENVLVSNQFNIGLVPVNGHNYVYVHRTGRPFSLGMCQI